MTEKFADTWEIKGNPECFKICDTHDDCKDCPIQIAINKLADYENNEEMCARCINPEDKVYFIKAHYDYAENPIEETVSHIYINKYGVRYTTYSGRVFTLDRLGVTVFKTFEEAEHKLKEIKEASM
jgi:hypothetical protein